jgi:hypothetical protein
MLARPASPAIRRPHRPARLEVTHSRCQQGRLSAR